MQLRIALVPGFEFGPNRASMAAGKPTLSKDRLLLIGRNGTATEPFAAMPSRCPGGEGHVGKLKRYVRAAGRARRAHFRGLNDPFGVRLNPHFGRDRSWMPQREHRRNPFDPE